MNTNQPQLGFEQPTFTPPGALARTIDPPTSHQAAVEIEEHLPRLTALAVEGVRKHPGCTRQELNDAECHGKDVLGKRLDGARKAGLLRNGVDRRCRISDRVAQTWFLVGVES